MKIYKITIQDVDNMDKETFCFLNEDMMNKLFTHEVFNSDIADAKTGEVFKISDKVLSELN